MSGKRTLIQEQNSYPGIVTRNLSGKVDKICIAFNETKQYLDKINCVMTGNPIRKDIQSIDKNKAREYFGLELDKPVVFFIGGSQGSLPINLHLKRHIIKYIDSDIQILWQCGKRDYPEISKNISNKNIHLYEFIDDIGAALSTADLVVSRAGAIALSELSHCGKASILIPFPNAAENHQYLNARSLADKDAAIILEQNKLKNGKLEQIINELIANPDKIQLMEKNAKSLSTPNATEQIVNEIIGLT